MRAFQSAKEPTMYFVGVTTAGSSVNATFPLWMDELGIDAKLVGVDFVPNDVPGKYRQVVEFIKEDPFSCGALITTHKINLFKASSDLFDALGDCAQVLGEVSCISKRGTALWGHAVDPATSGIALDKIIPMEYFSDTQAQMLILGAGGSSLALTLHLNWVQNTRNEAPTKLIITDINRENLGEMKKVHRKIGFSIPVDYVHVDSLTDNDIQVGNLVPYSMVVNATGVGKDLPGSPITDGAIFPQNGILWEFNYRGERKIIDQAKRQQNEKNLRIEDGWNYFVNGWIDVIEEVFHLEIPRPGPQMDRLIAIANQAVTRQKV